MREQRQIRFEGTVQGVGFRYTARQTAEDFSVAGWVRNLPDGAVELVAEGEPAELDAFLAELRQNIGYGIRREYTQTAPAAGLAGFEVRF